MTKRRLWWIAALTILVLGVSAAVARADETPVSIDQYKQRLDIARATLDDVGKALAEAGASADALRVLRERVAPLPGELDDVVEKLAPRLTAIDASLKELYGPAVGVGPTPAVKEQAPKQESPAAANARPPPRKPTENAKAANKSPTQTKPSLAPLEVVAPAPTTDSAAAALDAEQTALRQRYDELDSILKRARGIQVEARQMLTEIVARQRALFAEKLFLRTEGFFSPALWREALADLPGTVERAKNSLQDSAVAFLGRLHNGRRTEFLGVVFLIFVSSCSAVLFSNRFLMRSDKVKQPTKLMKSAGAAWAAIVITAVPIAAMGALRAAIMGFDLVDASLTPILQALAEAVARVAFSYALARAIFAPARPQWRLLDPGKTLSARFVRLAVAISATFSLTHIVEQLGELAQASLPMVIVTRGVGVTLIAAFTASAFATIPRRNRDIEVGDGALLRRDWLAIAQFLGLAFVAGIFMASAAGYVTFANFVILEAGWLLALLAMLEIALGFASAGVEAAFDQRGLIGRLLRDGLAIREDTLKQMAVALAGVATLMCYAVAAALALLPFGVGSNDFLPYLQSAFYSFTIGDVTISPYNALTGVLLFAVTLAATQGLRRWLERRFLPLTQLDRGLRNSISTSVGYAGFTLALAIALSHVGLSFEKLAIIAGALSVGIGFGLQSIVNNFLSGLILLWERAIRVGDWVVIGDEQGYVKRINVRSTEIETFDRATMIVPNSNLVTGVVKNWLRGDKVGRIKIALAAYSGANPEKVRDVLLAVAGAQEGVLRTPAPQVMFLGMEGNMFRFELWCYVEDVEQGTRVRSNLYFELHKRLVQEGVALAPPPPPTIIQFPDTEKLATAVAFSVGEAAKREAANDLRLAEEARHRRSSRPSAV
jgi:potassium-dependent mechanosensitive channel